MNKSEKRLFQQFIKWVKQVDLGYPDDLLEIDFENFIKNLNIPSEEEYLKAKEVIERYQDEYNPKKTFNIKLEDGSIINDVKKLSNLNQINENTKLYVKNPFLHNRYLEVNEPMKLINEGFFIGRACDNKRDGFVFKNN